MPRTKKRKTANTPRDGIHDACCLRHLGGHSVELIIKVLKPLNTLHSARLALNTPGCRIGLGRYASGLARQPVQICLHFSADWHCCRGRGRRRWRQSVAECKVDQPDVEVGIDYKISRQQVCTRRAVAHARRGACGARRLAESASRLWGTHARARSSAWLSCDTDEKVTQRAFHPRLDVTIDDIAGAGIDERIASNSTLLRIR